ncbi:MAG: 1,4-dihydroxy-2-naphthoate octaprenyltransferase [Opitutae bacterium]|nr:1,4-dihydroxy-2-naphthoate octaprenyltransferase [Opitutae bacterium]MBT5717654.1 1,4-dihydroxy-2-naphthoate octaprenyltransferase [Opitutae bacterium]
MNKKLGLWLLASRPKTLVASIIPVSLGVCLAYKQTANVEIELIIMCFLFSVLVQVATNFSNDYFDSLTGADDLRELAPARFAGSELIKGTHLRNASYSILVFAFFVGLLIMEFSGASRILLFTGVCSVLSALAYTGGPFPFAYNGLGDLFVVIFFGFVAICTTHYVLVTAVGKIWEPNWIIPLGVGFMINNLLVVNNYRDRKTDVMVSKKTTVVLFGKQFGEVLYFIGFFIPCVICPLVDNDLKISFILFPFGGFLIYRLFKAEKKKDFDFLLSSTAISVVMYGCSLAWAIVQK